MIPGPSNCWSSASSDPRRCPWCQPAIRWGPSHRGPACLECCRCSEHRVRSLALRQPLDRSGHQKGSFLASLPHRRGRPRRRPRERRSAVTRLKFGPCRKRRLRAPSGEFVAAWRGYRKHEPSAPTDGSSENSFPRAREHPRDGPRVFSEDVVHGAIGRCRVRRSDNRVVVTQPRCTSFKRAAAAVRARLVHAPGSYRALLCRDAACRGTARLDTDRSVGPNAGRDGRSGLAFGLLGQLVLAVAKAHDSTTMGEGRKRTALRVRQRRAFGQGVNSTVCEPAQESVHGTAGGRGRLLCTLAVSPRFDLRGGLAARLACGALANTSGAGRCFACHW